MKYKSLTPNEYKTIKELISLGVKKNRITDITDRSYVVVQKVAVTDNYEEYKGKQKAKESQLDRVERKLDDLLTLMREVNQAESRRGIFKR